MKMKLIDEVEITKRLTQNKILIKFIKKSWFDTEKEKIQNLCGLWTFNLILITTSTNLQNKLNFIFLSKPAS